MPISRSARIPCRTLSPEESPRPPGSKAVRRALPTSSRRKSGGRTMNIRGHGEPRPCHTRTAPCGARRPRSFCSRRGVLWGKRRAAAGRWRGGAKRSPARQYRRLDLGTVLALAAIARECRPIRPARRLVEDSHRTSRKQHGGHGLFSFGPSLAALPAMGHAGRGLESVAARHLDPSGLWSVARISRRIGICRRLEGGSDGSVFSASMRFMYGETLSCRLSRWGDNGSRLRCSRLPVAFAHATRAGWLHGRRLSCTQCLPERGGLSLSRRTACIPYGCTPALVLTPSSFRRIAMRSEACAIHVGLCA